MSKFWSSGSDFDSSGSDSEIDNNNDDGEWDSDEDNDALLPENGNPRYDSDDDAEGEDAECLGLDPNATWEAIEKTQVFLDPPSTTATTIPQEQDECVRIVCISDTHGKHNEIRLPPGDILIHGGDFTKSGEVGNIESLSTYFLESGFGEICCIAGNHDMTLHPEFYKDNADRFHSKPFDCDVAQRALKHCTYLKDSSYTSHHGFIEIYGSPWSPEFFNWAFNLPRGPESRKVWQKIPDSTDVLITHGPPLGRGDLTRQSGRAGCYDLLEEVTKRVKPRVHVFGHIHEAAGVSFDGHTLYINASNLNLSYKASHRPVVVDLPLDKSKPAMIVQPQCNFDASQFLDWLKANKFNKVAKRLEEYKDFDDFMSGNELLESDAYGRLRDTLQLHRDGKASFELNVALSELYTQSFPR